MARKIYCKWRRNKFGNKLEHHNTLTMNAFIKTGWTVHREENGVNVVMEMKYT